MGNGKSKSSSRGSATRKLNTPTPGRAKPMTPKAGVTKDRRRFENGGAWCY